MQLLRSFLVVIALAAILVGCGSSGGGGGGAGSEPSDAASTEPEPSGDPGLSPEPVPSDEGGSGGSGGGTSGIPEVDDGAWNSGTINVEISGDKSESIDASLTEGGGYTIEGYTILAFSNDAKTTSIQLTLSNTDGESGIAITTPQVVTGGAWGDTCEIEATVDGSKLRGEFRCDDVDSISPTAAEAYLLDTSGEFEVSR